MLMADFVAVIRKAVDGLANNTPENRAKVYDKARSAVVRQLENMKPRPPEELLRRQIAKLDAAIAEVDSEYAEALPALEEDDAFTPAAEETATSYYREDVAEEPAVHAAEPDHASERQEERYEPVEEEPAPAVAAQPEPVYEEPAREEEPLHEAPVSAAASHDEERYAEREPEELYDAPEPVHVAPAHAAVSHEEVGTYFTRAEEEPAYQPEAERDSDVAAPAQADDSVPPHWAQPVDEDDWRKLDEAEDEHARPAAEDYAEIRNETDGRPVVAGYAAQHYQAPDVSFEPDRRDDEDYAGNRAGADHDPIFGGQGDFSEPRQTEDTAPKKAAVVEDFSSYFQDTDIAIPAKDAPALPRADNDPFGDRAASKEDKERTPWDDLDELIGYDGASSSNRAAADETPALGAGAATPAYMVKKKPRRNYASLVLALVGAGLLAGGGYALWQNRDALNDMVGGLVQSAQKGGETQTPSPDTAQQTSTPPAGQQPPAAGQQPATNPTNHQAQPHGDDGSVTGTKFTQRLLADGSERDEGPAPGANGQPVTAEGQSVYEQNVAPPPAGEAPANTAGAPAGTPAGTPPAQQPAAAATGDRMFLYEEVLGQTVPTAIQGSVSWSLQQENDNDGRPSPTVQGQITVPGRGLSALITFKRNTDPSLPASHLIEIVFSVSPGFEGGAIDSVQRIAMKSTEQDRGNALIAVPAKITDDFHMIALNDFPDAMKTNLELLKSRNWIDIPVSYRNGRRALLTLQKGNDGIAAFDKALSEWAAATPAAGGQ
ncbi:hypothetical protein CFBP6625_11315 [Agrobacterium tumefaciens]|nr:hypothetical protein CFBP6625_11315 [Agrobacterium tumefaciens]